eukprot:6294187-Alexandrium_andersonii.AAC.1
MSASLVGSEMCIRDRCLHDGSRVQARVRAEVLQYIGTRQAQGLTVRAPVSYTHLTLPTICSV